MILTLIERLRCKRVVLASSSPRRRQLLGDILKLPVHVQPSSFPEDLRHDDFPHPAGYVAATAEAKARDVWSAAAESTDLLVAADSVVIVDGLILEKAGSPSQAREMLKRMSGRSSTVITAVVLIVPGDADPVVRVLVEETHVHFAAIPEEELDAYVADRAAWEGKAGAYGIQDVASVFIPRIEGDYYNVMGFPIHRFCVGVRDLVDTGLLKL
jgi:septum formation protein